MLTNGLVGATPSLLLLIVGVGAGLVAIVGVVLALLAIRRAVPSIRRRHLVVDGAGLVAVRNGYRLRAGWADVAGFDSARFALVFPVAVMNLHRSQIEGLDGGAVSDELRRKVEARGAGGRLQIGLYVEDIRQGRFGELLNAHRPDLGGAPTP